MIVCHAHAAEDRYDEKEKDALGRGAPEHEDKPLHDMESVSRHPENAAACEHLHICVVVHIREQPVFNAVRPIGRDGREKPDPENGHAEKVPDAVFPNFVTAGIVEAAFQIMAE